MAAGRLEQQVAGVELSIAFLKQQHRAMLTGLQLEISHLRRRCQELSCELDSRNPAEEARLVVRCSAAERLLEERRCATLAARGQLRAGRDQASALGRSLREDERRFLDELKHRSHKITLLSRELHRQNAATSSLCHKLHAARFQLLQRRQNTEEETTAAAAQEAQEAGKGQEEEEGSDYFLSPPTLPEARQRRRLSLREDRVRACVPQERVTSPQSPLPMPDPALFLVPLGYRLLRLNRPIRTQEDEGLEDEWEDIEDVLVHRRVDMGAGEGETAL